MAFNFKNTAADQLSSAETSSIDSSSDEKQSLRDFSNPPKIVTNISPRETQKPDNDAPYSSSNTPSPILHSSTEKKNISQTAPPQKNESSSSATDSDKRYKRQTCTPPTGQTFTSPLSSPMKCDPKKKNSESESSNSRESSESENRYIPQNSNPPRFKSFVHSASSESGDETKDNESDVKRPASTNKQVDLFLPTLALFDGVPEKKQRKNFIGGDSYLFKGQGKSNNCVICLHNNMQH